LHDESVDVRVILI